MRGLDPRIHALATVAGACGDDVDGRIKSGHDDFELRDGRCILGFARIANFPGQPCVAGGINGASTCDNPERGSKKFLGPPR